MIDQEKTGRLIASLRKKENMTQEQLAEILGVSNRSISRWECGQGCPELSLLKELAEIFNTDVDTLLSGERPVNGIGGGNMKKTEFYVCPECGNLISTAGDAAVSCCGRKLEPLEAKKAEPGEKLSVEIIDNEYYVSSDHEMTKEHYIGFVALLTGDTLVLKKQYPEWDLSTRIPRIAHGTLIWYCSRHGLFYQLI